MSALGGLPAPHTFLVVDYGLFMEFARRLKDDGHTVVYYTDVFDKFPKFEDYAVGLGIVKKGVYFFTDLDQYDPAETTIVFPDVGYGDWAVHLRRLGWSCFGAGRGDVLENERQTLKKVQAAAGLPVQAYEVITGVSALREYLADHPKSYVKIDVYKGNAESFSAEDPAANALILNRLEAAWGPFSEWFTFVVEEFIETDREVGSDGIFSGGQWLGPMLWGVEIHKGAYAGTVNPARPSYVRQVEDALAPQLAAYDYRGFCSTEQRVTPDGTPYLIDLCSRAPSPCGLGYANLYDNFSEVIYAAARNLPVTPQYRGQYLLTLPLMTDEAEKWWIVAKTDPLIAEHVKFRLASVWDGRTYFVPGAKGILVLVAVDDDLATAYERIMGMVDQVDAEGLETEAVGGLNEAVAALLECERDAEGSASVPAEEGLDDAAAPSR